VEIRKESKALALSRIKDQPTKLIKIAGELTSYNGWRLETNLKIIQELEITEFIKIEGGLCTAL